MTTLTLPETEPWSSGQAVAGLLQQGGHQAWFVGGCVRDLWLGREVKDVDLATDATPDQVETLGRSRGWTTVAVGKSFGVVVVVVPGGRQIEVATFRSDGAYIDGRRPTAVSFSDLATDVERRDFTCNALLMDPRDGRIEDRVGGIADLAAGVLRTVGDPRSRLAEDRLRVLRGLRFAASLGLRIESATWQALCATTLEGLSPERVIQEWDKGLRGPHPGTWLRLVREAGQLTALCPPVGNLDPSAITATGDALERLDDTVGSPVRQAVALHAAGEPAVTAWLSSWPFSRQQQRTLGWLLDRQRRLADLAVTPSAERWRTLRDGPVEDLVQVVASCTPSHPALDELRGWAADPRARSDWKPTLRARELVALGWPPGPALGRALAACEDAELAEPEIGRDRLLVLATRLRV